MKKFVSILLSVIMLISSCSLFAFSANGDSDIPTIFVDGIVSTDTVNTETGETVFPPSAGTIVKGISGAVLPLVSSLVSGDYSKASAPVCNAAAKIFEKASCDENGLPVYPTGSTYQRPDADSLYGGEAALDALGIAPDDLIWYSYDWRLDMVTLSEELHEFIEYVLDATGAEKVNLVGFSMGTCVVMTYLNDFDYQYVNGVVLLAGAFNGVSCCGEPFSGKVSLNSETLVRYINTVLGQDFSGFMLEAVIDALYQAGLVNGVIDIANDLTDAIMDDVYETVGKEVFAQMAGFWSLMPYDIYDGAKALLIDENNVTNEYIAKIDHYHYDIQGRNKEILDGALERNINVGIIAKYGSTIPPVCDSGDNIGDSVIDTVYESFGATCAKANSQVDYREAGLGDDYVQAVNDGHNHISADRYIDASTCAYPEYTWFLKNLNHSEHNLDEWALIRFILDSDTQPTVWDNKDYPQFLICVDDEIVPLTKENNSSKFGDAAPVEETLFMKILHVLSVIIRAFKALFGK